MKFTKPILILGILTFITPLLGIPTSWRLGLVAVFGLAIAILAYLDKYGRSLYELWMKSRQKKGGGEKSKRKDNYTPGLKSEERSYDRQT